MENARRWLRIAALLAIAACSDTTGAADPNVGRDLSQLSIADVGGQAYACGDARCFPFVLKVTAASDGRFVSGATVHLSQRNGGFNTDTLIVTDAGGFARTTWALVQLPYASYAAGDSAFVAYCASMAPAPCQQARQFTIHFQ